MIHAVVCLFAPLSVGFSELSVGMSVSVCLSGSLSVGLCACPYVCLSVCLYVCLKRFARDNEIVAYFAQGVKGLTEGGNGKLWLYDEAVVNLAPV